MASLTQDQVNALKNKGLTDEKIKALALQRGFSMPEQSVVGSIGSSLIKSEKGFGQSIAGAIGDTVLGGTKSAIEQSNQMNQQVQTNLLNAIKTKKAKGEDTTRLVSALKTLDSEVNFYDILNTSTGGSLDKSAKQVFGEGLGVATDIASVGSFGTGAKSFNLAKPLTEAPSVIANTFGKGLVQGAKTGAKFGAGVGGVKSFSGALQDNASVGEALGSGVKGAIEGGVGGAVIGGVTGGVSGAIAGRAEKVALNKHDFVLDLVSPKTNKFVSEQAIKEGRVTEPGLLGKAKIIPSTKDYRLADAVDEVVSSKNSVLQNADAINRKVTEINDGVRTLIKEKKAPFNTNQLLSRLNAAKEESKLVFASDANAENTYNAVVDEFMKHVKSKDTLGLFDARQTFDKVPAIRKLLESEGLGENVKKQIVLDVRRSANEYIASLLPANNPYRAALKQESAMLEAVGNLAEKNASMIGKNKIQLLITKHPALKYLIPVLGSSVVGAGVGGAIASGN